MISIKAILIADTDSDFLARYVEMLGQPDLTGANSWPGCPVHVARTHDQARAVLEKEQPDVVILDIALPGGDSREFMQWIRKSKSYCHTAVIMTYPSMESHEASDRALGIDMRLIKPIDPNTVLTFLLRMDYFAHS